MTALLFIVFLVLLAIGFPIAFALGISAFTYLLFSDIPLMVIPQKMYAGIDVFVLLSFPVLFWPEPYECQWHYR